MKPFYPIRGVLRYHGRDKAKEIVWREPPHRYFANLPLDWKSLLAFDHKYGPLLREHLRMNPELKRILDKAPNNTPEERQKYASETKRFEIRVSEGDVELAKDMQSLLRDAWKGVEGAVAALQYGERRHMQQGAFGKSRLTVMPSEQGVDVEAEDLWSFIRVAFLLDYKQGRTKVCHNPACPAPFFLAKRKDQRVCERGECTVWAQRQWSLQWWNKEGRRRRAKAAKKRNRP